MKKLYIVCLLLATLLTGIGIVASGTEACSIPGFTSRHNIDADTIPKGKAAIIKNDTSLIPLTRSNPRDPRWITDTIKPSIPLSDNPYYKDIPMQNWWTEDYRITGGRSDVYDLNNIVIHSIRNPDTNNMNFIPVRIDFFDMDNHYRGTFDVRSNNPYTSDIYAPLLSENYFNAATGVIDRRMNPGYNWRAKVKHYATYVMYGGVSPCETVALAYYLQALDSQYNLIGILATFILLDNHGREVARFEDVEDVFFGQGILTCDHRYFCLQYGGDFTVDGGRMYNNRFRIYDVVTKQIIHEIELPEDQQFTSAPIERPGGWVQINYLISEDEKIRQGGSTRGRKFVFDIHNEVKYTSPADVRLNYVRSFTEDGFIIKDQVTGEFERIWYEDWHVERF